MHFTPKVEGEVVREEVLHRLERHLVNQQKQFLETQHNLKLQPNNSKLVTLSGTQKRATMKWRIWKI